MDETRIRQAASLACEASASPEWRNAEAIDLTIMLGDDALLRQLNERFRGRDEATDILSFPAQCFEGKRYQLGDVALSEEGVLRGAANREKDRHDHLLHLVVHGVLHLGGLEHRLPEQAARMESLEIATLKLMSITNPYAPLPTP